MARRMLGSFPSLNLHDPETYIATICALLCQYPEWAGEMAMPKALARDECRFIPPTAAILKPLLEDVVSTARFIRRWDDGVKTQMLRLEGPHFERPTIEQLREKYGENWGLGRHKAGPSKDQIRAEIIAEIGQEAFDAIPDAKR